MKKGDIVRNKHQNNGNPFCYQIVIGLFNEKGARTIDYMGNTHIFDDATEHMEVVGHSKEYDCYTNTLKRLCNYCKSDIQSEVE